jgi:negative regulator of flagellin synthesis FlgM
VKIDNNLKTVGAVKGGTAARAGNARPAAVATPADTVQVQLSPLSSRLQEIESSLAAAPAVDAQRVAEIKQAIAQGRFTINPDRIAAGLLESVSQMLGAGR